MSRFSGKCDLYDHIAGQGGWFNSEGQPIKLNDPDHYGPYYSDELKDFEAFKKKTGGVIHQHYKIKVDEYNQDFVKEHCKQFDFREGGVINAVKIGSDVFKDEGKQRKKYYIYTYYGKDYTLKDLNKHGVYIETDIHFDTLLDLIPYYPYIVSCAACDKDKEYVVISNESYVDSEFKKHLQNGWISCIDYKKELQKHYLDVCKKYFLYKLEERTKVVDIKNLIYAPEIVDNNTIEHYYIKTDTEIDYRHNIEFVWADGLKHSFWSSPKFVNTTTIEISKQDVNTYLSGPLKNGPVKIKYVEKCEFPLEVK